MPLYEYRCLGGHVFNQVCKVDDRLGPFNCPLCGQKGEKVILHAPRVFGDYEGYASPASGRWIEGRRQREEDLRRTGCRPYEAGEREHAQKVAAAKDRALDREIDAVVEQTLSEITS